MRFLQAPLDPTTAYQLAEICVGAGGALFTAVSAIAAWMTVRSSSKSSKDMLLRFEEMQKSARQSSNLNRSIQTVLHCNLRYHDLEKERVLFDFDTEKAEIDQYVSRYWSLKSDQFYYWLAGFVDPDAFMTWFSSVARHFTNPNSFILGHNYRDLWIHVGREYHRFLNPWFLAFIDSIERTYFENCPVDRDFAQLEKIISSLEGIENKKGITWQFRDEFQKGMTFPSYQSWSKKDDFLSYLPQSPWPGYEFSCSHPNF